MINDSTWNIATFHHDGGEVPGGSSRRGEESASREAENHISARCLPRAISTAVVATVKSKLAPSLVQESMKSPTTQERDTKSGQEQLGPLGGQHWEGSTSQSQAGVALWVSGRR